LILIKSGQLWPLFLFKPTFKNLTLKKIVILFLIIIISKNIYSQNSFRSEGTLELGGSLGFSSQSISANGQSGGDASLFSADLFFGVMASQGFEIGFIPRYTHASSGLDSYNAYTFLINPAYNFIGTNAYPFIGGLIGYDSNRSGGDKIGGLATGGQVGIKFQPGENGLFILKIEYLNQKYNFLSVSTFSGNAGFSIFLERKPGPRVKEPVRK
jgi:hypothetical protein